MNQKAWSRCNICLLTNYLSYKQSFVPHLCHNTHIKMFQMGNSVFCCSNAGGSGNGSLTAYLEVCTGLKLKPKPDKTVIWACVISKSLYSTIFLRPRPQPPAVGYPNQSECSAPKLSMRTEQTGHTDSMLKKQGRWVQNRIRTWWPKKMHVACRAHSGE